MMPGLCRDCGAIPSADESERCGACASPRLLRHAELFDLTVAHLDCDAFYAAVEKRDNPDLVDKPVIIGGGRRGVVATACYIARLYGVRSAMPMYRALEACPDAVVLRPNMAKYQAVGRRVRALMRDVTPRVEPISIDEAYLDLSEGGPAAPRLVALARRIEDEIGISASIGLSYNKFLAKLASDMDKPRGFSVLGRAEARDFLKPLPVSRIWGVGPALTRRLARDGISRVGQLQDRDADDLAARYGTIGHRLAHFAVGEDAREVKTASKRKSVSAETTFETDTAERSIMEPVLRRLSEQVGIRLNNAGMAGHSVVLKLKTTDFRLRTRTAGLAYPTQSADVIYRAAVALLAREADGTRFRLIGIGAGRLTDAALADPPDLLERD